ncbi:type II toxin-antitoxin system VapC family toxin [Gordonia sp. (in: high G+C Gram-positive bacteria)]|uniref:type II toxin-antitoxin system VapC family toxin n=1 Tax=Gordonia sp. (in: high G+C Gram-positive bacteria) TaxID=84139 RepID=UPI001D3F76B8|nr:PIN domain-containing protein [Gordonia sp. (in: high G+C Gram-positive bacteria)]MCB1296476.1 PIN domain-containing protein [Gordonia sp. (in: high G+C Gram-positive bacteria)]HMS74307.1 PIN domain-containing protein [Gordonia sp. (in: high G+C Gram-positive bacteria)]HQV19151.1 PIN domain-containing protein [Gordonia sp. (in: high G+C Gram-positive bacteria)]
MTQRTKVTGLTLDTGALLALERGDSRVRALLGRAVENGLPLAVPAGVVAQAWRGGPRQARVAHLLADPVVEVVPLDDTTARAVGLLCGRSGHADVVDVHVALHARERGHTVVTSDPDDLRSVDPAVRLIAV